MFKAFNKESEGGGAVEPIQFNIDLGEDAPAPKEGEAGYVAPTPVVTPTAKKYDFSSFKEIDPEINDDNFIERVAPKLKGYKDLETKVKELEVLAAGRDLIDNNENINRRNNLIKMSDEDLYYSDSVWQYMNTDGLSKEAAEKKASEKLADLTEKNKYAIEEKAQKIRADLKGWNAKETQEILESQKQAREKNRQAEPDTKKRSSSVLESIDKAESVFDMVFPKDEALKSKVDAAIKAPARQYIESGQFEKDLNDPDFLAQIAIFGANKKRVLENLAQKQPSKSAASGAGRKIVNTPHIPPRQTTGFGQKPANTYK